MGDMRLLVELEFSADGYETEEEELNSFKCIEELVDSAGITLSIIKVERLED